MIDNGTQLTNLGMQLNNIGSQIQNISMDLEINSNYRILLQNIGIQISDFSYQIFNIGMLIKNVNQQQPFEFQMNNIMNNNMNKINFNNANIGMNINNINDNMNGIIKDPNGKIISIAFENKNNGITTSINISQNSTIKELLNSYRIKIGEDLDFLKKNYFYTNGKKTNPNDKRTISEYHDIRDGQKILVFL